MKKIEIQTTKTARYFVLGDFSEEIDEVWIVCHGYSQLAKYFLKKFECITSPNRLIIAPEGLHRFYTKGTSGRVGASWMTKEDRFTDINDYVIFLDNLLIDLNSKIDSKFKVKLLGFSQGAATACRWLSLGKTKIDSLILWGSVFPDDIDYFDKKNRFNNVNLKLVIGDKDEYYSENQIEEEISKMKSKSIQFELIKFSGNHDIYENPLKMVSK